VDEVFSLSEIAVAVEAASNGMKRNAEQPASE
jgi:hypothetical protein